jgi:hypothetical protein
MSRKKERMEELVKKLVCGERNVDRRSNGIITMNVEKVLRDLVKEKKDK